MSALFQFSSMTTRMPYSAHQWGGILCRLSNTLLALHLYSTAKDQVGAGRASEYHCLQQWAVPLHTWRAAQHTQEAGTLGELGS